MKHMQYEMLFHRSPYGNSVSFNSKVEKLWQTGLKVTKCFLKIYQKYILPAENPKQEWTGTKTSLKPIKAVKSQLTKYWWKRSKSFQKLLQTLEGRVAFRHFRDPRRIRRATPSTRIPTKFSLRKLIDPLLSSIVQRFLTYCRSSSGIRVAFRLGQL